MFNIFQFDNPCWTTSQPPTKAGKWIQKIERLVLASWSSDCETGLCQFPPLHSGPPPALLLSSQFRTVISPVGSAEWWGVRTEHSGNMTGHHFLSHCQIWSYCYKYIYSNREYKYVNPWHSNSKPARMSWCGEEWWEASVDCGVQWTDRNLCCVNLMFSNNLLPHTARLYGLNQGEFLLVSSVSFFKRITSAMTSVLCCQCFL